MEHVRRKADHGQEWAGQKEGGNEPLDRKGVARPKPGKGKSVGTPARSSGQDPANREEAGRARGGAAWEADPALIDAMGLGAGEPLEEDVGQGGIDSEEDSEQGASGAVQHTGVTGTAAGSVHQAVAEGISGAASALPHQAAIQRSFGHHDISGVRAHTDGAAARANAAMGSEAYATGDHVAFSASSPSLHTAAHEAAHVVQQRSGIHLKGGVGQPGDAYEQHADAVADRVVAGRSAADLLDEMAPHGGATSGSVQHKASSELVVHRAALDAVIMTSDSVDTVIKAFQEYWGVDVKTAKDASAWEVSPLRRIHQQLKRLPEQDVRSGGWKKLLRGKGSGGSMSDSGVYEIGENAGGKDGGGTDLNYGVGTKLKYKASAGDTQVTVQDGSVLTVGKTVAIDRPNPAKKEVRKIKDKIEHTIALDKGLSGDHEWDTPIGPDDDTSLRKVNWLEAVTRHEIAHAVDNVVNAKGFYALEDWWVGDSFEHWSAKMGNPWGPALISDEDKKKIGDLITAAKNDANRAGASLAHNTPPDHPIHKWLGKGVPVIEAAETCFKAADSFWTRPQIVHLLEGRRFSINFYYQKFQYCNDRVYTSRVNTYNVYSPAEFFAEVYSVYYEEAGKAEGTDADLGRLVPVAAWRDWIRDHVHNRGMAPSKDSDQNGDAGVPKSGGVGKAAGNPGMT